MYARYDWNAGANHLDVFADIVKILTGTTDKTTLSAACSQAGTEIIATVPAGWSLHDDAASATSKVLKAPISDDPTKDKYLRIGMSATYYGCAVYEAWNATAHTGTNMTYTPWTWDNMSALSFTVAGTMFLFASSQYVFMQAWYSSAFRVMIGATEITRQNKWDTVARGVPPFVVAHPGYMLYGSGTSSNYDQASGSNPIARPRSYDENGASITTSSCLLYPITYAGTGGNGGLTALKRGLGPDLETGQFYTLDIYCHRASFRADMGGKLIQPKLTTTGGATSDELTIDGAQYFYTKAGQDGNASGNVPCYVLPKF